MMAGRYAHIKQFRRHQRQLRFLRSRLGRIIRDMRRKIEGQPALEQAFALPLGPPRRSARNSSASAAGFILSMPPKWSASARARPPRLTSSASRPPSSPTTAGLPVACSCCMPGRCPITPTTATPCGTSLTAPRHLPAVRSSKPMLTRGTAATTRKNPRRVFISDQKRGVFGVIKRELRRRSAIEPIIGHLKAEGHLGRCYLKGRAGDAADVALSTVGHKSAASSLGSENSCACSRSSYCAR